MPQPRAILWAGGFLIIVVVATVALKPNGTQEPPSVVATNVLIGEPRGYPPEWRTSLAEAKRKIKFQVAIPGHPKANADNLSSTFVFPPAVALVLDFPPPNAEAARVRQDYIEVYEAKWTGGDPSEVFANDIATDPTVGKSSCDVFGYPGLCVEPESISDVEQRNPAFVRFVVQGVEVQVSGGDDLSLVRDIAEDIAQRFR